MKKWLVLALVAIMTLGMGAAALADEQPTGNVIFWGLNPEAIGSGNAEMLAAFHELYPGLTIEAQTTPGTEGYSPQDVTKLLASIAAGSPPDATSLDRFTAGQYAARNALMGLDELCEKYGVDINEYEAYTVNESLFEGVVYSIPTDTDTRPFYWNKDVYRDAGLDPEVPPVTWDELYAHTEAMNIINDGVIERLGFLPNWGNGSPHNFIFSNGGTLLSEDGRTSVLYQDANVEAMEFQMKLFDLCGGAEQVNAYKGAFLGEADNPFLIGTVGSVITVNNAIQGWAQYAPDLDYGAANQPANEGNEQCNWSGGWSYAIPNGSANPDGGFLAIRYFTQEGLLIQQAAKKQHALDIDPDAGFLPFLSAHMPTMASLVAEHVDPLEDGPMKKAFYVGEEIKSSARIRPVSPVAEVTQIEIAKAYEAIIYGTKDVETALKDADATVQAELDKFWADYEAGVYDK